MAVCVTYGARHARGEEEQRWNVEVEQIEGSTRRSIVE